MRRSLSAMAIIAGMFASLAHGEAAIEDAAQSKPNIAATDPSEPGSTESRDRLPDRATAPLPGQRGKRLIGSGSGFFIAPDKLLTNFHVVKGCGALSVGNNSEGKEVEAHLLSGDQTVDLAVVSASPPDAVPAQFRTSEPDDARDAFAIIGYPEHGLPVLQAELDSVMIFPDDVARDEPRYPFYGPVRRGNSGGPLLDNSGAVIGVAVQKVDTVAVYKKTGAVVDDLGIAIANRTVFKFLADHGLSYDAAPPGPVLSPNELLAKAHGFVRQVRCWN